MPLVPTAERVSYELNLQPYGSLHKSESASLLGAPFSQVTEKNGGDDGTRTRDLCRDRAAF